MSNSADNPSFYTGFIPGQIRSNSDGTTTRHEMFELPGGREAMVAVRHGEQQPDAQREAQREEHLLTIYPPSLTEGLEQEIGRLTQQFNDFTGYDKQGQPIMRVQGRQREILEMKLANRKNALVLAKRERALAERVQARAKASKQAEEARITAAAEAQAQRLIEQAEIDRRAKQIAARSGVNA